MTIISSGQYWEPLVLSLVLMAVQQVSGNKVIQSNIVNIFDQVSPEYDAKHTCKKREIPEIYLRKYFWIFRKILG